MTHTPAPWIVDAEPSDDGTYYIQNSTQEFAVAEAYDYLNFEKSTALDNARLIAAAPDLLDALERLFEHTAMVHNRWGENSNTEEADSAIRDARAAIQKARNGG